MFDFLRKKKKNKGNEDCPAELLDLLDSSKSDWRKGIIKEFIDQHNWRTEVEAKLERIKWQNAAILGLLVTVFLLLLRMALGA